MSKKRLAAQEPRYRINAGSPCEVKRVEARSWQLHRTRRVTTFDRAEQYEARRYIFRLGVWQMRVHRRNVELRQESRWISEAFGYKI